MENDLNSLVEWYLSSAVRQIGITEQFDVIVEKLEEYAVRDPAALAAWIGRKKYGKEKFQKMATAGKRKKSESEELGEVSPEGWEGTVKAMKKHPEIDNPWALSHWMKGKGYHSHKSEDVEEAKKPKLGSGKRFANLVTQLKAKESLKNNKKSLQEQMYTNTINRVILLAGIK
jgi:hypothetical protein